MSRPRARIRGLLLEEAPEGPARLVGMDRPGGGVTLDRDHHREQRALVAGTLVCDPLGNPLPALETAGRIEVGALAAGVQLDAAVRALGERVGGDRQHRAALGAARGRGAVEDAKRALRLGRLGRLGPVLAAAAGTPVTLLPISTVGHHATPAAAGGTSCTHWACSKYSIFRARSGAKHVVSMQETSEWRQSPSRERYHRSSRA